MAANVLLALISLVLATSPYLSKITLDSEILQSQSIGKDSTRSDPLLTWKVSKAADVGKDFEIFIISLGTIGFLLAIYNMFLRRKNGSPYIAIGALVLMVGFFYNGETIPLPINGALLGGELFLAFVVSFILAVAGTVAEWFMEQPN